MKSKPPRLRRQDKQRFMRSLRERIEERKALNEARILEMFGFM